MTHHVTDRFADYVSGELERTQRAAIDAHLDECTLCREEYDSLLRLWSKLEGVPPAQPPQDMRPRFTALLEAYEAGARHSHRAASPFGEVVDRLVERFWPTHPGRQVLAVAVLIVIGIFGGMQLSKEPVGHDELTQLRTEVQSMGHLLALSLLNQRSASERITGVSWSTQIDRPDKQVLSALVNALRSDPNVNVRLASVDALGRFLSDPDVRNDVLESIQVQTSPLVQIALVDLMVERQVPQSRAVLSKLAAEPGVNPLVRQRIEDSMVKLPAEGRS